MTAAVLSVGGCAHPGADVTAIRTSLVPDQAGYADLDGDGELETILFGLDAGSLTITDGEVVYRARDRWTVIQACLGDTNGDGRPEVVALLDADDGRHLGLFSYFAGAYRERLVTRELSPAPVTLQLIDGAAALPSEGAGGGPGDVVVLTQPPAQGQIQGERVLLRWNGFSFTRVGDTPRR